MSKKSDLAYGYLLIFALVIYFISEYFIIVMAIIIILLLLYFLFYNFSNKVYLKKTTEKSYQKKFNVSGTGQVNEIKYATNAELKKQKEYFKNYIEVKSQKHFDSLKFPKGICKSTLHFLYDKCTIYGVKEIKGDLLANPSFTNFGELERIEGNLILRYDWYYISAEHFKEYENIIIDFGNLNYVGGDIIVSGTISSFGNLEKVGKNLNLRYVNFNDFGKIKEVGGNLLLKKNVKDSFKNFPFVKGQVRGYKETVNRKQYKDLFPEDFKRYNANSDKSNTEIDFHKAKEKIRNLIRRKSYLNAGKFYLTVNDIDFSINSIIIDLLFFQYKSKHLFFNTKNLLRIIGHGNLTEFSKDKIEMIIPFISDIFKRNDINELFASINYEHVEKIFNRQLDNYFNPNSFTTLITYTDEEAKTQNLIIEETKRILNLILRDAENSYRQSVGVKNVGEAWTSEMNLLNELRQLFSNTEIIHHASPDWLGRQHLDIFFPKYNIGVEYQGEQHYRPIEFFGGEDAFKKNIERDKRKRELCKKNSCHLIEVKKGYDIDDLKKQIEESINK